MKNIINKVLKVCTDNQMTETIYLKNPMGGTVSVRFLDNTAKIVEYNMDRVELDVSDDLELEVHCYDRKVTGNRTERSIGKVGAEGKRLLESTGKEFRFQGLTFLTDGTETSWRAWLVEYEAIRPLSGNDLDVNGECTGG